MAGAVAVVIVVVRITVDEGLDHHLVNAQAAKCRVFAAAAIVLLQRPGALLDSHRLGRAA